MRNPVIVRIVSLDVARLSILELLEYNLERRDINYALSEGVHRYRQDNFSIIIIIIISVESYSDYGGVHYSIEGRLLLL